MAHDWPLVGRGEELELIREVLADPNRAGVALAGGPGVGKTRLARHAADEAAGLGWAVEWVTATHAASSIPFAPFVHLLPRSSRPTSGRLEVLRQAHAALAGRSGGRTLVLAIDDAHLLDSASAALIHQVGAAGLASLVVTLRTGEPVPDAVASLWREGRVERVELQPLGKDEVSKLLEGVLRGHVESSTLDRMWDLTRGNVLFLRELVIGSLETGALVRRGGIWRWKGGLAAPRLTELVESGLGRLSAGERTVLEVVALGEPLEAWVVARVVDESALEKAERKSLLAVSREERRQVVRLAHPLHGEVVRGQIPTMRAAEVRRRLAQAVEQTGARRRGDVLRVAVWRLDADGGGPADLLLRGARDAQGMGELLLAERLARASVRAGGGVQAGLALASGLYRSGRHLECLEVLETLDTEAVSAADRANVAELHTSVLGLGLGRPYEATQVLRRAESAAGSQDIRTELTALRVAVLLYSAPPKEVLAVASGVLASPRISARARARALLAAAGAQGIAGQPDSALVAVDATLARVTRIDGQVAFVGYHHLLLQRCLLLRLSGRLEEAITSALDGHQAARSQHAPDALGYWCLALGRALLAKGQAAEALRWLKEASELFADTDPSLQRPWCLASLAQAAALAGELEVAEAALADAESTSPPWLTLYRPELRQARVWVLAARGERTAARRHALEAAEEAAAFGQLMYEVHLLHDLVRLGDAKRVAPRLNSLAAMVEGPIARASARHAIALSGGDAFALDAVSSEFESTGAILLAAEAAAEASGIHQRAGRRSRALASMAKAQALQEACGGALTAALSSTSESVLLTSREREVAALAAAGLPNRRIAERLGISIRTVENHLRQVYDKVGVSRRSQLPPFVCSARAQEATPTTAPPRT
jgi:DNA-binding CsgD family transcriptional regulator